jgi:Tfp pilus assembly protein PilO
VAFYVSALAPAHQRLAALDPAPAPTSFAAAPARELDRFHTQFPAVTAIGEQLEQIHRLARASGLELTQGEYRLERPNAGLWPYRVSLPLRGSYAQMRVFIAAVLLELPAVAVDALRFERKRASETRLDAQLRFTLYVRPTGDAS